ncbi:hypothetical protein ES332_D10G089400v1 [Gossypium tomentosum]|uniref:Uncharacterized protein n=1 Tax=Gossypium tomentosum TaxID=34277 RepID=A0A5D2J2E6_GOSTO|nr:hypothetical protein ES332_D10G089400v1 [Gossypium tomentosum]
MEEEKSKIVKEKKKRGIDVVDRKKDCGKLEGNEKLENGKKLNNGGVKKFRATDVAPANATKEVYASIFTSSKKLEAADHVTPAKDAKEVSVSIFTLKKSVDQFRLLKGDLLVFFFVHG